METFTKPEGQGNKIVIEKEIAELKKEQENLKKKFGITKLEQELHKVKTHEEAEAITKEIEEGYYQIMEGETSVLDKSREIDQKIETLEGQLKGVK